MKKKNAQQATRINMFTYKWCCFISLFFFFVFESVCSLLISASPNDGYFSYYTARVNAFCVVVCAFFFSSLFSFAAVLVVIFIKLKPAFRNSQKNSNTFAFVSLFGFEMSLLLFYANVNSINFIDLPHCQLSTRAMCTSARFFFRMHLCVDFIA